MNGNNINYVQMGRRVRNRRVELQLTQENLAERIDVSMSFIGHIERGEKKAYIETLVRLCAALSVTADYLLFGRKHLCDKNKCRILDDITELISGKWDEWA